MGLYVTVASNERLKLVLFSGRVSPPDDQFSWSETPILMLMLLCGKRLTPRLLVTFCWSLAVLSLVMLPPRLSPRLTPRYSSAELDMFSDWVVLLVVLVFSSRAL